LKILWQTAASFSKATETSRLISQKLSNLAYEWLIGLRYTRASRGVGRKNGFISFISGLSVAGIALGVAALIIVLSVMNGFQKEVRDRMLSVLSHIEVSTVREPLNDWQQVVGIAKKSPRVLAGAPYVAGQAMLTYEDIVRGVLVRGIDPAEEGKVSDFVKSLVKGKLTDLVPGEFGIIIGKSLSNQLGIGVGDKMALIAPQGTLTPAGVVPRLRQFTVVGLFESGHYEYDTSLLLTHMSDAGKLFRVDGVSGVRLVTDKMMDAPEIAQQIAGTLPPNLIVRDWSRENRNWFAAVQIEKRMMFIILLLIIAVAAFNLVSMLVMTVTDKQSDIAILRTLGAPPSSIMKIFMIQGSAVGLLGTLAGIVLGVLVALNVRVITQVIEGILGFQVLPAGVYFINYLPSDLHWEDVTFIALVASFLALVATVYPSWRASKTRPAEALRYE
jgi:lipoprotein-releasing system permease protein